MKLSYLILSCMLQLASSRSLNFWSDSTITAADYPVPGDNPMSFCTQADLAEDILQLGQVDLSPNPPEK